MDVMDEIDATELADDALPYRIVVPLSGSYHSMRAVPHASDLARRSGAKLMLITVPDPLEYERASEIPSWLNVLRERVDLERVDVAVTAPGDRAAMILDVLSDSAPAALCMATHARRGVSELVHHHVAQTVLHGVQVPAWLVGRDCSRHPRIGPILVVHDGSRTSDAIVEQARSWARALGVSTRLVHVVGATNFDSAPTTAVTRAVERLGLETDTMALRSTFPAEAISELAGRVGAGAIAVALPPITSDHEGAIGRLAAALLRVSPVPLLMARGDAR